MWNKPKYSTYHLLAMVSQNEEGKIVYDYLDVYSDANKIANFANKHRDNLSETQLKTISMLQDS